jgi:hypothetical protein
MLTPQELLNDVQAETGESSTEAMDLLGALALAESVDSVDELKHHLFMARNLANTILANLNDQLARLNQGN